MKLLDYIFCSFWTLTFVSLGYATVFYVPQDYPTIQAAIDALEPDSVSTEIVIAEGDYLLPENESIIIDRGEFTLRSSDPDNPAVVENTILRGNRATVIFLGDNFSTGTLTIKGLTIRDGFNATGGGGGINGNSIRPVPTSNYILIEKCRFINNYANIGGGAIYYISGEIRDSYFYQNVTASVTSPLGYVEGGAVARMGGSILNSTFEENQAGSLSRPENTSSLNGYGGAISYQFSREGAEIRNCTFIRNHGQYAGGAISDSYIPIINCTFKENFSHRFGGAINFSFRPVVGCFFIMNRSGLQGGAMHTPIDDVINNKFIENEAGNGGGIFDSHPQIIIGNNLFYSNTAQSSGAIGNFSNNLTSQHLVNNIFWANTDTAGLPSNYWPHFMTGVEQPQNCIIEGWGAKDENGNSGTLPNFIDPRLDENNDPVNYNVHPNSFAIDNGILIEEYGDFFHSEPFYLEDALGNPRPFVSWQDSETTASIRGDGSGMDIGPMEYQEVFTEPPPTKPAWVVY